MKDDDSNRTNKTSEGSNEVPNLVDALDGSNGARSLFVQSQFMACAIFVLFVTYFWNKYVWKTTLGYKFKRISRVVVC